MYNPSGVYVELHGDTVTVSASNVVVNLGGEIEIDSPKVEITGKLVVAGVEFNPHRHQETGSITRGPRN